MGYTFYIACYDEPITEENYNIAKSKLTGFNRLGGLGDTLVCDMEFEKGFIRIGGSHSVSGDHAEGFVLNMLINLIQLRYTPTVLSKEFKYGTDEEWKWFDEKYFDK